MDYAKLRRLQDYARAMMEREGLTDWRFRFDGARSRYGVCRYRVRVLSISKALALLNPEETSQKTIAHEVAHALTRGHHHDSVWRRECLRLGGDGQRCYDSREVETVEPTFKAVCESCGATFKRFRRPRRRTWCSCQRRPEKRNPDGSVRVLVWGRS